jgi:hypothetical protein
LAVGEAKICRVTSTVNVPVCNNSAQIQDSRSATELCIDQVGEIGYWHPTPLALTWGKNKGLKVLKPCVSCSCALQANSVADADAFGGCFAKVLDPYHTRATSRKQIPRGETWWFIEPDPSTVFDHIVPFGHRHGVVRGVKSLLGNFVLIVRHAVNYDDAGERSKTSKNTSKGLNFFLARPGSKHLLFFFLCLGSMYLGITCFVVALFMLPCFGPTKRWKLWVPVLCLLGTSFFYLSHSYFDLSVDELKKDWGLTSFDRISLRNAVYRRFLDESQSRK